MTKHLWLCLSKHPNNYGYAVVNFFQLYLEKQFEYSPKPVLYEILESAKELSLSTPENYKDYRILDNFIKYADNLTKTLGFDTNLREELSAIIKHLSQFRDSYSPPTRKRKYTPAIPQRKRLRNGKKY
jgi:hypothetical protein